MPSAATSEQISRRHCTLGVAEIFNDALLLNVAHPTVQRLDLTGLELEIRGQMRVQPVQRGDFAP